MSSLSGARRLWICSVLFLLAAACGGGGSVVDFPDPPDPDPDGIQGRVSYPDSFLGRISEEEPNDAVAQRYVLPPVFARTRLEVRGEIGTTAARFGRVDTVDVLRFTTTVAQDVALTLDFTAADPVSLLPNDIKVDVQAPDGTPVASSLGGATPQTCSFLLALEASVNVVITCRFGHATWLARFVTTDPAVAPAPSLPAASVPTKSAASPLPEAAPGHVVVRLHEGADPAQVAARLGLVLGRATLTGSWWFEIPTTPGGREKPGDVGKRASADPDVRWAEPDWIVKPLGDPNDAEYARQWSLRVIGAPVVWPITTGVPSVVVAVVDTGITPHPDLQGQTVPGYDFVSDLDVAADGDGPDPDPTDKGDRAENSGTSTWHGTFVAAVIAAKQGDAYGITGVSPGVKIMPLRALGVNGGLSSDVAAAILYACGIIAVEGGTVAVPAKVVNLSLGVTTPSFELESACQQAFNSGALLVAASGNSGSAVQYPAAYSTVEAVGAVDATLNRVGYSSFGPELDLVAPGGDSGEDLLGDGWPDGILSATTDETVEPRVFSHGFRDGTSGAAPHVAAVAALLWSRVPTLLPVDVRTILHTSALDRGAPGRDNAHGFGLVQADQAMRLLLEIQGTPRPDPPSLFLPYPSVKFHGLQATRFVPIMNGGGGVLSVTGVQAVTDDGAPWLSVSLIPEDPVVSRTITGFDVNVDRSKVPSVPGTYSGTLRISDGATVLGTMRILMNVQTFQRAGMDLYLVPEDAATGVASKRTTVRAASLYRYWYRGLPLSTYIVHAGEDLDGDGLFCESGDACGWYGGPTEADAIPVKTVKGQPVVGVDVSLSGP